MTTKRSAKRALLLSVLSVMLCVTMLVGTTFAWFTDSVTSSSNIIKSGTLDVEMYWMNGTDDPTSTAEGAWNDASKGAIFNYDKWEPGYAEVRHIKIENKGSLALKYQIQIIPNGIVSDLADAIDVFYFDPAEQISDASTLTEDEVFATLTDAIAGMATTASGSLSAGTSDTITIALKMREDAGNDYQNKSIGADFSIQLIATQYTEEEDSFDDQYDADAKYPPLLPSSSEIAGLLKGEGATTESANTDVTGVVFGTFDQYSDAVAGVDGEDVNGDGSLMIYRVPNATTFAATSTTTYTVYFLSDEKIVLPENSSMMFNNMNALTEIDTSNLDFSNVTNAKCMFTNCTNLTSLDTADWDMSNVTNMQSLFYGCNNLTDIDVSNWDTSNVTNMRMVFFRCYALPSSVLEGVENWDVSNVTNFYSMFKHAYGVTSLDLTKWDTSSATNMSHMFANIGNNLTTLDLSSFDTSKVTDMSWMFYSANKLTTIYVGDKWSTAALDPSKPTCFYNNQALVGGNGTTWLDVCDMKNPSRPWESSAKLIYAVADSATAQGLFTYKAN